MVNEALFGLALVLILCLAGFAYFYYRMDYVDKKVGMMEHLLMDMRMAMDSFLAEDTPLDGSAGHPNGGSAGAGGGSAGAPIPISSALPAAAVFTPPEPMHPTESETLPEESFYTNVLNQAHETGAPPADDGVKTLEEVLQGLEGAGPAPLPTASGGTPITESSGSDEAKYDSMTRQELIALAEQRGVRVRKSANRTEIINTLRRTETSANRESETGTENVSGPTGSLFPNAAPLDGEFAVDLGQDDANVVSA